MCLQWEFENLYRSIEDPPHLQSDFGECQKSTIHLTSPLKFTSSPTCTPYNPSSIYTRQTLKVIAAEYRDNISNNRRIHFFSAFFGFFFVVHVTSIIRYHTISSHLLKEFTDATNFTHNTLSYINNHHANL